MVDQLFSVTKRKKNGRNKTTNQDALLLRLIKQVFIPKIYINPCIKKHPERGLPQKEWRM